MRTITAATTFDDILENPNAYGAPTFTQFRKNKAKWLGSHDDQMIALSEGPTIGRKDLKKIRYQLHGVDLLSEDTVERALNDHGYSLADIDLDNRNSRLKKEINMIPLGGGKFDVVVNFLP